MKSDLLVIERKVDLALRKFDLVLAKLDEMNLTGKPGLTQRAFAKLIGRTPRTVGRMVATRRIRLEKGLVPNSEVRRWLS